SRVKALLIMTVYALHGLTQAGRDGGGPGTFPAMLPRTARKPVPMLNRRGFLAATAGFAAGGLALPDRLLAAGVSGIELAAMRGSIDAADLGVRPGALDDQRKAFARMLRQASDRDAPVFLPAGTY